MAKLSLEPQTKKEALEVSHEEKVLSPRSAAIRRVLKRRSYDEQSSLLASGVGRPIGPGEEMELAQAGFRSPSVSLPQRTRLEKAFGTSLSHVKAHIGSEAHIAARALGAEAYALGTEVAFRDPTPKPETVAHEVAHVLQQTGHHEGPLASEATLEREADFAATKALGAQEPTPLSRSPKALRKKEVLPSGEKGFKKMWEAHPHNYQDNPEENTSSAEILEILGFPSDWNTCAIRMSIMLNTLGYKITPQKAKAAGLKRKPMFSQKTKQYYILAASEMAQYLQKNFRQPDAIFPKQGRYKDVASFEKAFEEQIRPLIASRKGIVFFDKIFGYSGSGHVDLFDGEKLSDAPSWYSSERLLLWYVVVPNERLPG